MIEDFGGGRTHDEALFERINRDWDYDGVPIRDERIKKAIIDLAGAQIRLRLSGLRGEAARCLALIEAVEVAATTRERRSMAYRPCPGCGHEPHELRCGSTIAQGFACACPPAPQPLEEERPR